LPPVTHTTGQQLYHGRFSLVAPIGRGGSGMVWEARDAQTGSLVAIKLLIADAGGLAAVEREAEAAVRVRHPNAVQVLLTFEDADCAGVVMERCVASAADRVAANGPVAPDAAVRMITAVLAALTAAHAAGVVHRDIKPANILLRADGSAALSDWGIARALFGSGVTHTTSIALLGTLPYLAPELRQDPRAASPATDLYAVGITLAWLVTGKVPPDPFVPAGEAVIRAALPARLADVVLRACAWEPSERYASAAEMAAALTGAGLGGERGGVRAGLQKTAGAAGVARRSMAPKWLAVGVLGLAVGWLGWETRGELSGTGAVGAERGDVGGVKDELPWCDVSARGFALTNANGPRETVAVGAADVDGDGLNDALFTNQLDESVTIWWGAGDRRFVARQNVPAGRSGFPAEVGDFDGDGHADLLLSLFDDNAFALVRGSGDRAFKAAERIMQGPSPREARFLQLNDGPALLFPAGPDLNLRRVKSKLPWPGQERIGHSYSNARMDATIVRAAQAVYTIVNDPSHDLFVLDLDGHVSKGPSHPEWPEHTRTFAADLTPEPGEELYAYLADASIIRLPLANGEPLCRAAPPLYATGVLTHLDDDGIPDEIAAETCAGCTSNQIVGFGQGG